jgi:hypothetical protein
VSRPHHDLDLLVRRSDLSLLVAILSEHGFREKLVRDGGPPVALCDVPWLFDEGSLSATGVLDGYPVRCVTATTQIQMHAGYHLHRHHQVDADRLRHFLEGGGDRHR